MNLDDSSRIIYPAYSRNIYEDIDLSLEAMFQSGEDGSEYHPTSVQDPGGFLGSNIYFLKLKYSF